MAVPVLKKGTAAASGPVCSFEVGDSQIGIISLSPSWISSTALSRVWFYWGDGICPMGAGECVSKQSLTRELAPMVLWHFSPCNIGTGLQLGSVVLPQRPEVIGKTEEISKWQWQLCKNRGRKPASRWSLSVGLSQESMNHQRGSRVTTKKYVWQSVMQRVIIQT